MLLLLQGSLKLLECRESPPARPHAIAKQHSGNHDPEGVHQNEVAVEIVRFRPRVRQVQDVVVEQASRVVEDIAVDLAERHDGLEWVAERMISCNEGGREEGERAPENLHQLS